LNLRPPGYEPGELPDCSTPRRGGQYSTVIWLALAIFLLVSVAGVAYAIRQGVGLWRTLREFAGEAGRALDELDDRAAKIGSQQFEVEKAAASVGRLQRSVAQLSLLVDALGRVRSQASGLLAIYPRK
jgi:hypothetical protein